MPKVLSFVGRSDSGKTTLITQLIVELKKRAVTVAVIKHAHQGFDLDRKGSDSAMYQAAGADAVMLASPQGMALMRPCPNDAELDRLIDYLPDMDLVIIEGYKREKHPKIEVYRADCGEPPLAPQLENLIAMVGRSPVRTDLPVFAPDDMLTLTEFIITRILS